jgi:hypothetical protein
MSVSPIQCRRTLRRILDAEFSTSNRTECRFLKNNGTTCQKKLITEILYTELNLIPKYCMPNWTYCRTPECRMRLNAKILNA